MRRSPPRKQQRGPGGVLGEEHHRLARRVAAAHHGGAAAPARARVHRGAGIEDPRPIPTLAPGDRKTLVGGAGGDQDGPAAHDLPVVEDEPVHFVLAGHRANLDRGDELGPELQGLEVAPVGQVRPGQSGGESHVILDPRAGPRLTTRAEPVEDDGGQPLGGTVDGRRESGRTGSDDHQVEWLGANLTLQAQALGQPGDRGARRSRAPVAGDERQLIRADPQRLQSGLSLRLVGVDPGMRHLVLVEELADDRHVRIAEVPEEAHADETGAFQHDSARLERLEQLVAEVGDLLDHPAQLGLADAVGPARSPGVGRDDGGAVGQQRDVARELARTVNDDRLRLARDSSTIAISPDSTT